MKVTGIVRSFDALGRIVIPKEMRKRIFGENVEVEIFSTEDSVVIKPGAPNFDIETAPVIHGNIVYRHDIPHCSICGKVIDANSCYCKWCGAKMESGAE